MKRAKNSHVNNSSINSTCEIGRDEHKQGAKENVGKVFVAVASAGRGAFLMEGY